MFDLAPLATLLSTTQRIRTLLEPLVQARPLRKCTPVPTFCVPDDNWLLPQQCRACLSPSLIAAISSTLTNIVEEARKAYLDSFQDALGRMVSVEDDHMEKDEDTIRKMIAIVEASWSRAMTMFRDTVIQTLEKQNVSRQDSKRVGTFHSGALRILEAAYSRQQVLSQKECTLVAQAAGITHQQVRTWFQNRRNRKRGGTRKTSNPDEEKEEVIPPSKRVISSLPKRARGQPAPATATEGDRPIRGLPKRKQPSPTPSQESNSTVDSTPVSGGFTSPLDFVTPAEPMISFDGRSSWNPQPLPAYDASAFNFDQLPMLDPATGGLLGTMPTFDSSEFEKMLQQAMVAPTLGASPTFTSPSASDSATTSPPTAPSAPQQPSTAPVAPEAKALLDGMTDEQVFAYLEEVLSKSKVSTSSNGDSWPGTAEGSQANLSAELQAMISPSGDGAITPLDISMASVSSGSGTPQYEKEGSPISVDTANYPQLNLYPPSVITPISTFNPIQSLPIYPTQSVPTQPQAQQQPQAMSYVPYPTFQSQPQVYASPSQYHSQSAQYLPGNWIQGALPFETVEQEYFGGAWMMDGQGYTHPRSTVPCFTQGMQGMQGQRQVQVPMQMPIGGAQGMLMSSA